MNIYKNDKQYFDSFPCRYSLERRHSNEGHILMLHTTHLLVADSKYSFKNPSHHIYTYLPTKFSSTELLPALCPPTTAICGRSSCKVTPIAVKASCSLLTTGINCSMPALPDILQRFRINSYSLKPNNARACCASFKGGRWKIANYGIGACDCSLSHCTVHG